jgi:thiol-disulfide isomerase/thioredoxin
MPYRLFAFILLILGLSLAACGGDDPTATPEPTSEPDSLATLDPTPESPSGEVTIGGDIGSQAPEFQGISNWINSEPLSIENLRGKVVLVDFWTYTCVNCIRTLPYIKDWQDKYASHGLVIVGVHSPEFEFEKIEENVVRATEEYALTYPVAQDNDFETWRSYENPAWPAKYLVDANGIVRYTHIGEGAYDETEMAIRTLLTQAGADLDGVEASYAAAPQFDPRARSDDPESSLTRELYGGYRRNYSETGIYVGQVEYYDGTGVLREYVDPEEHFNHRFYLHGPWFNGPESVVHGRATEEFEDYIALKFFATSVNAVIDPQVPDSFEVQVTIDGRPMTSEEAGEDIVVEEGRSYFVVDEPRMYRVVETSGIDSYELTLSSTSEGFALFAFTFGAYEQGP